MRFQHLLIQLRETLSVIVVESSMASRSGLVDHNQLVEKVVCEALRVCFDMPDITNLNVRVRRGYPAIDLADRKKRVAVQVTASAGIRKIKRTLETFERHGMQRDFDRLVMFITTRKKARYSQDSIDAENANAVGLDVRRDILDFDDVLVAAEDLPPTALEELVHRMQEYAHGIHVPGTSSQEEIRHSDVLSSTCFSEGLRGRIRRYNAELQYLTIEQLSALEVTLRCPLLWVEGDAGTGKTILAVEAAYRALFAGSSVLIVYRSTQFSTVFRNLLSGVDERLFLLPHLDFMYLLRLFQSEGATGDLFTETVSEMLPELSSSGVPFVDFAILDDCGSYETRFNESAELVSELGSRILCLAAPDQAFAHLVFGLPEKAASSGPVFGLLDDVQLQELVAPDRFEVIKLTKNLRNARSIAEYAQRERQLANSRAAIKELGVQQTMVSNWSSFDEDLLSVVTTLLEEYPPDRIRVLVDPHLYHPALRELPVDDEELRGAFLKGLPALSRCVLAVAFGCSFLYTTLEEEELLLDTVARLKTGRTYFVYTDGEEVGVVAEVELKRHGAYPAFLEEYRSWYDTPRVLSKSILEAEALRDLVVTPTTILVYSSPLFIGLESEVVIYVRSREDEFWEEMSCDEQVREDLLAVRRDHHFLAMSRARSHLVDLVVTSN